MKRSIINNPNLQDATWEAVKKLRDEIEQYPIKCNGIIFDSDELSIKRMELAVEQFDNLPTVSSGQLAWKAFDNSIHLLSKAELSSTKQAIRMALAMRSSRLHLAAESIRLSGLRMTVGQARAQLMIIHSDYV